VHAGLDGLARRLEPPPPTERPYATAVTVDAADATSAGAPAPTALPTSLGEALDALQADLELVRAMGQPFVDVFVRVKRQEQARAAAAEDPAQFDRREYFGRC
jgi:glutamine synthetase